MCIICPPAWLPVWTPIWSYRETLARLTPFWTVRHQVDKIIERDRRLIRKIMLFPGYAISCKEKIEP